MQLAAAVITIPMPAAVVNYISSGLLWCCRIVQLPTSLVAAASAATAAVVETAEAGDKRRRIYRKTKSIHEVEYTQQQKPYHLL